ncbi:MAG: GLUG motif-containing protein, partial [Alloprevotella sp.]
MKKHLLSFMTCVVMLMLPVVSWAAITPSKPANGDGSKSNPYQISTAAELYWFAALVNGTLTDGTAQNTGACAKLMADITVNSGVLKSDGTINSDKTSSFTAWVPIGYNEVISQPVVYTGLFEGNGKTISGLYFEDADKYYVGLFGISSGTIQQVGIVDSYFHADRYLGSICGYNQGYITHCYGQSYLYGADINVGGVCGVNYENSTITNCYHIGTIYDWEPNVGGVCGYNYSGTISNCYHAGNIEHAHENNSGSVCGNNTGTITNCYYDSEKCSVGGINRADVADQAVGKSSAQFQSGEMAMVLQGNQSREVWGQTLGTDNYPVIGGPKVNFGYLSGTCDERVYTNAAATATPNHALDSDGFCTRCGGCQVAAKVTGTHHSELNKTHNGYYAIENAGQLYWFAALVSGNLEYMPRDTHANAVLTTNITVNQNVLKSDGTLADDVSSFKLWNYFGNINVDPSATQLEYYYYGIFDGNNHTISGLYVNKAAFMSMGMGLFSYSHGTIKDLGVIDSYFNGEINIGAVCADNFGTILNCYSTSTIACGLNSGGVCGINEKNGIIRNCYNAGLLDAPTSYYVGGVCGNNAGVISDCYNTGKVNAVSHVGGVCGKNNTDGSILNCYSANVVSGSKYVGGVCGYLDENSKIVKNCYYDNNVYTGTALGSNPQGEVANVEGKTTAQFQSGEVAHLLAKTRDTWDAVYDPTPWGQEIGVDDYPVLGGKRVYCACTEGGLVYTNYFRCNTSGHDYDNGFCKLCDSYEPAQKVSETHHPELNATHNGYYAIENAGQLYWLSALSNGTMTGTYQDLGAYAVLTDNITVNKNVLKADGSISDEASTFRVWTPIGYYDDESYKTLEPMQYHGHFDGNGKTVSGLYYDFRIPDTYFIGLFGAVGQNATGEMVGNVTNVGVVDSYFHGREEIAGICGACLGGHISNCYSSATVKGTALHSGAPAYNIAGICGGLIENGTITNCYNTGRVSGTESLGGICGLAIGTITNCYNTGSITGEQTYNGGICGLITASTVKNCYNTGQVSGSDHIGGVLGGALDDEGPNTISNCYYDNGKCTAGGIDGADVAGKAEGKSSALFAGGEVAYLLSKGANGSVWGQQIGTDPLPVHNGPKVYYGYAPDDCQQQKYANTVLTETPNHNYGNGFCATCDGYQPAQKVSSVHHEELVREYDGYYAIENAGQLYWFADQVNHYYQDKYDESAVLTADITVNEDVLNPDGSLSVHSATFRTWPSIGYRTDTQSRILYGSVDGNGHLISGLYSDDADKDYTGVVGYGNGTIQNLGIVDTYFKGKDYVGSICGYNVQGNILNCYSASSVAGTSHAGSICGYNYNGIIANNYYDNEKCAIGGVNGADVSGQTAGKSADKFHNGEVAYLLTHPNNSETEDYEVWGQQLGTDLYPVGSDYKLVRAALKPEDNTYWATYSDMDSDITLSVPADRTLKVYNATVSGRTMTLTERADCQVAVEEGVLLKTDGEYVNAKANEDYTLTPVAYAYNHLVATPYEAQTVIAEAGYKLYRLTYNNASEKTGL